MDAGIPAGKETNSAESAAPPRRSRWLPAVSIAASGVLDVALLRYAVDLLAPLCATLLLTHSVRDALCDWLAGDTHDSEPDPVWAVGVIGVNLFATVLGVLWIFGTSSWVTGTSLGASVPAPMVRMANLAEEHGWGRRAVLPGGPVDRSQPPLTRPAGMTVEATRRPSPGERTGSLVGSSARAANTQAAGTTGQATTTPDAVGQEAGSIRTTIALASSTSVLRVGLDVLLTATVTASRGRVSGGVVFRRGEAVMGSARLDRDGRAALRVWTLPRGTHTITAEFTGNDKFTHSRSEALRLIVTP